MEHIQKGIYTYMDAWNNIDMSVLPIEMLISENICTEALLIRLLCGTVKVKYILEDSEKEMDQKKDYSVPGILENTKLKKKTIKDFFSLEHYRKSERNAIDRYLKRNRRNHFVHEEVLNELTGAFVWEKASPIEAFVHIYRSLEFMSYSFPLIYASKSMDYRGSYEKLKKFMSGDSDGELKFFKTFLKELFKDNMFYDYEFEIYFLSQNEEKIERELDSILKNGSYSFDGNTMKIRFANIADLIITMRNRYFHMLVGKGMNNFYDTSYDKREIFIAMNPIFINWLSMIYKEIASYSLALI